MKKWGFVVFIFVQIVTLSLLPLQVQAQSDDDIKVSEYVEVVNVEVPVRVFYKGQPVDHLTRDDFVLYEGKKRQAINGFYVKRKKIEKEPLPTIPPRYFVFIFDISHFNEPLAEALKYLFDHILRAQDQLMVFANDESFFFGGLKDRAGALAQVESCLRESCRRKRLELDYYLREFERMIYEIKNLRILYPQYVHAPADFLKNYLRTWRTYKLKHLVPDIDKFYNFAKHLERIKKEKWVINFYQMELFPRLKPQGEFKRDILNYTGYLYSGAEETMVEGHGDATVWARDTMMWLDKIEREMNVAEDFPAEEVSKIFYKVDATFHSIFIPTTIETLSNDLEYKRVSTDIENMLRELTEKTGGSLVTSANIKAALTQIDREEDVYYILTYAPIDNGKRGRIKVKVANKDYQVLYDDNMRSDYIAEYVKRREAETPDIKVRGLAFKNKRLSLEIKDFQRKKIKERLLGKVNIHVTVKDKNGSVLYDKTRVLTAEKAAINISIPFAWMKRGEYDIIVDVGDVLTGKKDTKLIQI